MISILIPVYNYDCSCLVTDLNKEIQNNNLDAEIIVAEDGSEESFKVMNRCVSRLEHCSYVEFFDNKGRSRIRNLLAGMAKGEWLVFIDCDAGLVNDDFIRRYYNAVKEHPDVSVVCGGLEVPAFEDTSLFSLRYCYSVKRERRSADKRMENPYASFSSFNFMISSTVFRNNKFDEDFVDYGHEDTLFGEMLRINNVSILHIDNPLYHLGLEKNDIFLRKTKKSIEYLCKLRDKLKDCSRLYKAYSRIRRLHMSFFFNVFFRMFGDKMEHYLLNSNNPSMFVFDIYKLCYLVSLMKNT